MLQPVHVTESLAQASLSELQRRLPLPQGWSMQESFLQDVRVGDLRLYMAGLVATHAEQSAMGSATQSHGYPVERAYFELLERISIYEACQPGRVLAVRDEAGNAIEQRTAARVFAHEPSLRLRLSLSNGVALHANWPQACTAARHELIERDRVLRSFAGEIAPVRLSVPDSQSVRLTAEQYETAVYELGRAKHSTAVWIMMPRQRELPISYGFGTADSRDEAVRRAEREALQRLAFLWGEELPAAEVLPAPTPEFHQEYYLYPPNHSRLSEWLAGQFRARHRWHQRLPLFDGTPVSFIDLTPAALSGSIAVAKAVSASARRLRFGLPAYPPDTLPHPIV